MSYELALKLKDAGFPQKEVISAKEAYDMSGEGLTIGMLLEMPYLPTLSELIEACRDRFQLVGKRRTQPGTSYIWRASSNIKTGKFGHVNGDGKTPSEAVARLWLALNPKLQGDE